MTTDPPMCLLCNAAIEDGFALDVALAAFAVAAQCGWDDSGLGRPTTSPTEPAAAACTSNIKRAIHADAAPRVGAVEGSGPESGGSDDPELRSRLSAAAAACHAAAATMIESVASLQGTKQGMVDRAAASVAKLEAGAAAVIAAVNAHVSATKAALNKQLNTRTKAIDAQLEGISVSAGQLQAGAAMCTALLSDPACTLPQLTAAHASITRLSALIKPYHGPCVGTLCDAVTTPDATVTAVQNTLSRLRLAIDETNSSVSGDAFKRIKPGGSNTVLIALRDNCGILIESLPTDTVTVTVVVADSTDASQISSAVPVHVTRRSDGMLCAEFTVPADTEAVTLDISLPGDQRLSGSPWTIHAVCRPAAFLYRCVTYIDVCALPSSVRVWVLSCHCSERPLRATSFAASPCHAAPRTTAAWPSTTQALWWPCPAGNPTSCS